MKPFLIALTLLASTAFAADRGPKITKQPQDVTAEVRTTATFSVEATGSSLNYIWYRYEKDGSVLVGSNRPTYAHRVAEGDNGSRYGVIVWSLAGIDKSKLATLTVIVEATPTPTATWTPSPTPTATPSASPTPSPTASSTPSPTPTATPSISPTPTATPSPSPTVTPTATPSTTPVGIAIYPKGVWALSGTSDDIDDALAANLGIVGANLGGWWYDIEKKDGVYDFSSIDKKVAAAKAKGFTQINVGVTDSSEATPKWLLDELVADGVVITFLDPGHEGTTYGKPILTPPMNNPRWHAKRLALIAATGAHFKDDPAIVATMGSFNNHRTMDSNLTDTVGTLDNIPSGSCPPPAGSYVDGTYVKSSNGTCTVEIDQPQQWLDHGFTRAGQLQVGKDILTATANAWGPSKLIKLPIGGLDTRLANTSPDPRGGPGNYSTLAYEIIAWFNAQPFGNRVYISRNTMATTWGLPLTKEPSYSAEGELKWFISQQSPRSGLQSVTSVSMCIEDGKTPCRIDGNATTKDLEDVMQRALNVAIGYKVTFYEEWFADAKNPKFYDMTIAATKTMGGVPRSAK